MKKRVSKVQLKKALRKTYGLNGNNVAFSRRPGGDIIVTACFKDGSKMILKGRSLAAAAATNPRLAAEL